MQSSPAPPKRPRSPSASPQPPLRPHPHMQPILDAQRLHRTRVHSIAAALARWRPSLPPSLLPVPPAPPHTPTAPPPPPHQPHHRSPPHNRQPPHPSPDHIPHPIPIPIPTPTPTLTLTLTRDPIPDPDSDSNSDPGPPSQSRTPQFLTLPSQTQPQPSQSARDEAAAESAVALDRYQVAALHAAQRGESFFLTGSAGVGKSFVLRRIISALRADGRRVAVTASTGCAAVNVRGCTVHSLLGLGLGLDSHRRLKQRASKNFELRRRLNNLDVLVIDEISMIDSVLFDKIELVCAYARLQHDRNQKNNQPTKNATQPRNPDQQQPPLLPFGGLQVIVCGDFFQLPPVSVSDARHQFVKEKFFAFESAAWTRSITNTFCLHHVHRQSDHVFVALLNEIRLGVVSKHTHDVVNACGASRHLVALELSENGNEVHYTKLYPYRRQVHSENSTRLHAIPSQGVRYASKDSVTVDTGILNTRTVRTMLQNVAGLRTLELKKACRVICLKNLDTDAGIVNGSAGVLVGFALSSVQRLKQLEQYKFMTEKKIAQRRLEMSKDGMFPEERVDLDHKQIAKLFEKLPRDDDGFIPLEAHDALFSPIVKFDNGVTMTISEQKWDVYGLDGQVVGRRTQIPLTLGWALSIHKSQGMTLRNVEADVGQCFDYGQVYVALSRATSLERLRLLSFNDNKVMAHHKVLQFYEQMQSQQVSDGRDVSDLKEHKEEDDFLVSDSELLTLTACDEWWNSSSAVPN